MQKPLAETLRNPSASPDQAETQAAREDPSANFTRPVELIGQKVRLGLATGPRKWDVLPSDQRIDG